MTFRAAAGILLLLINPLISQSQNRDVPYFTTKNFISYKIGAAYPFFTEGSQRNYIFTFSDKSFNYACFGGLELGHVFNTRFSLIFSPTIIYSKFSRANYNYEVLSGNNIPISKSSGISFFDHLSLLFPIQANFKVKDWYSLSAGPFIVKPILDREFTQGIWVDYSMEPPRNWQYLKDYRNYRLFPRMGVHGSISFLLSERDWRKSRLNIEYYHSFTSANYEVFERWFSVSYVKVFYK